MAQLHPFRAVRPSAAGAPDVASLPYDVITREQAKEAGRSRPSSFLHVIRPEINLPNSVDEYSPEVYRRGRIELDRLHSAGIVSRDPQPALYLYQMSTERNSQTGLVACCSVDDYASGVIRRHEFTRPSKEDDRVAHIRSLSAHSGPVLMMYRSTDELSAAIGEADRGEELFDFFASDQVRHQGWRLERHDRIVHAWDSLQSIYIADGHHRAAAAAQVATERPADGEASRFLCVLFPSDQMRILAYNRYLRLDRAELESAISRLSLPVGKGVEGVPSDPGAFCFYAGGEWQCRELPRIATAAPSENLDIEVFDREVLNPVFGIDDQRTDPRVDFVGGEDSVSRIAERVDADGGIGFSFYPVSVSELLDVADSNSVMPPKSTWFAPKLMSGLFIHEFGER